MSIHRRAACRDDNEASIIRTLRRAGARVWQLSTKDIPDLLVGFRGRWILVEVKAEAGKGGGTSHRNLSTGQARFFQDAEMLEAPAFVVRNEREALNAIGVEVVG